MSCSVGPNQPDYSSTGQSGIPGNIGIVNAKAVVWDHDPFLARPMQKTTFRLSQSAKEQMEDVPNDVEFVADATYLAPQHIPHDMFIATRKQGTLDFVGSPKSGEFGKIAKSRLPGGQEYNSNGNLPVNEPNHYNWRIGRDIFPHQVWVYIGSLLKMGVPIHPSEYTLSDAELINIRNVVPPGQDAGTPCQDWSKWTIQELRNAPKWSYNTIEDGSGNRAISPIQITKPPEDSTTPVHWSLEKFTPVFQGEDFFVTISLNGKELSNVEDKNPSLDCIDTNINDYKYLIYNPSTTPSGWIEGISNEAFYVPKQEINESQNKEQPKDPAREAYWWRYKSYILIEVGTGDPVHNYFIEIVKGRHPRFLHLGYEWDHPSRLQEGADFSSDDFTYIKKCRVLSVYNELSTNALFSSENIVISVRNQLGRIIITFSGHENNPWVISRQDNNPSAYNFSKVLMPVIVPAGKVRIHGGNISATINFSPIEYNQTATIPFTNLQADTGQASNRDLYMTFSHLGNSIYYDNPSFKNSYFGDQRIGYGRIGYDCDAYSIQEVNKNSFAKIPLYRHFNTQFRQYGKGWIGDRNQQEPVIDRTENSTSAINKLIESFLKKTHTLSSGIDPLFPHEISIVNLRSPNQRFTFGLSEASDASYPYKDFASRWDVGVRLDAGSVTFPVVNSDDEYIIDEDAAPKTFVNVITPISTSWNLIVLGGGKPIQDNVQPIDISDLITSITDSWSSENFFSINHEMTIRAYVPLGVPSGGDPSLQSQAQNIDLHAKGQQLLSLLDKSFYITVSYWWDNGIGKRDAVGNLINRGGPPASSDLLIQMTGVVFDTKVERSVNKIFMEFKVSDYMSVLKKQLIFNSPFFDGVSDVQAAYDLMRQAHFDDNRQSQGGVIDRRPLGFLQNVIDNGHYNDNPFIYNGEKSTVKRFDLPGTYATISNPAVRFENGDSYELALQKLAQMASKCLYFDRWGVLRYENIPAIEAAFSSANRESFTPVYEFRTTPFNLSTDPTEGQTVDNRFTFNPKKHAAHLVYNTITYNRSIEDCVNQIVLMSASSSIKLADGRSVGGFIIEGYTFFDQIWDPTAEGFLGFRKPFYQSNGVFGGIEGIQHGLLHYAKMKFPPATMSFETYGVPGLKALDVISLDDNLYYITEISHEIDPETNNWWMTVSGEWLKPFRGSLGFLEERNETGGDSDE